MQRTLITALLALALSAGSGQAQSIGELLEKGIYTEETVGDLPAAIEIYGRIVQTAQAERAQVAQALFRLGRCQLKSGHAELAAEALRRLTRDYAEQEQLVAEAGRLIPGLLEPGLPIGPAPWEPGEQLRFAVKLPDGRVIGDIVFWAKARTIDGRALWRVEQFLTVPEADLVKWSMFEADRDSFRPVTAILDHSQLGRLRAEFVEDERRIMMNRPGEAPEPYVQKLSATVYDNEQSIFLVRRLPLEAAPAEGWRINLVGRPGRVGEAEAYVHGRETVEVPAGTFECFKTSIGVPGRTETHWISTAPDRRVVKVVSPDVVIELVEASTASEGPTSFKDETLGVSLSLPAGWTAFHSALTTPLGDPALGVYAPELSAGAAIVLLRLSPDLDLRALAEKDLAQYRERRPSCTVREGSWRERQVAGRAALTCVADVDVNGAHMVDRRIYVKAPTRLYWIVLHAERAQFERRDAEFDEILATMRLAQE